MENATQLVRVPRTGKAKHVPNELLVKLKPGADMMLWRKCTARK